MKELYIAPELKVTCFAPCERLAADDEIWFDDLMDVGTGSNNSKPSAGYDKGDLDLDL